MSNVSGIRPQDIFKGAKPYLQIGAWVTAAGGASFLDMGLVNDVEFLASNEVKKVLASNVQVPVDAYVTGRDFGLKFAIVEARLRHFAQCMNDDPAAGTLAGAEHDVNITSGVATQALDEQQATRYWQVKLTGADQVMLPAYTEDASSTYTKRTVTLWRCVMECKLSAKFAKDGEWLVPCTVHAVLDGSVTYSKGVTGRVGKIVDSVS